MGRLIIPVKLVHTDRQVAAVIQGAVGPVSQEHTTVKDLQTASSISLIMFVETIK